MMREELTKSFRNGLLLAQTGPISEITNFTTSTTYATIKDAVYLASSGDEIILPAGSGATHLGTFTRYSNFGQLNSWPGYSGNSSTIMVIGNPSETSNPSLYTATYLSIVGIPSSNNLSSLSWSGGQLTAVVTGSLVTTYRKGMYVRISGATNTGTGGIVPGKLGSINNAFTVLSVSGSTLVLNAPASAGVYGTIGGSPVLNNDRAQISSSVGYLTATLNPGDTTIHLDDATDFNTGGDSIYAWGNGDGTWQSVQMGFTGVSGNTLTGVTNSGSLSSAVPIGNPIMAIVPGAKAYFTPAATNPTGITMSNLELWGAAAYPSGAAIFQYVNLAIGGGFGSVALNNMFFHDNMFGLRPGDSSVNSGVFLEIFNTEFYRNGLNGDGFNHNAYVEADILTLQNSLSWQDTTSATGVAGAHLFKSRSRVNYMLYNRTFSDHGSTVNPANTWSANYDFPNGGEIFLIGCQMVNSLHDDIELIRWQEEMSYPVCGLGGNSNNGAANPISGIYVVNCDGLAPSNGIGINETNWAPIAVGFPGLKNPEIPALSTTSGGSLPTRSYWFATTLLDGDGNESLPSCMEGANPFTGVNPLVSIAANNLAVLASPITRTGGVNYNAYAAHADPVIWWNSGNASPPATGPNQFYYDSAFTLPMFVINSGGSQPASFVYVTVTYVFSEGPSVNFGFGGCRFDLLPSSSPVQTVAAVISVPVNSFLTIKSAPAITGATGWYPNVQVVPYSGGFIGPMGLSPQVDTPIAIGTDWVQSAAFRQAERLSYNFYKQNASPIALGTNWTEPTTGLVNLNPNRLKWYRRGNYAPSGFSRWFAIATSNYTNYVVTASNNRQDNIQGVPLTACVQVWSGATSPWPFDADFPTAQLSTPATSATATTAATNTVIFGSFRTGSAGAGAGWTQAAALGDLMSEYKVTTSPQTSLSVTQSGSISTSILVDAIAGASLTIRGTPQSSTNSNTNSVSFTIPSIVSGDILVMDIAIGNGPDMLAIDPLTWGPPALNIALNSGSPTGLVVNNLFAYYNPSMSGGYIQTYPGIVLFGGVSYPTVSSFNLQVNAYNGSGFNAPLVGAVWNNVSAFDFTLAGGSPAIGAGTNPGSGGSLGSLVPTFQTSMIGTPTPGYPIAALTARTDNGGTLGAIGSGGPPPPTLGPRLRFRFGWDWKLGFAIGAAALIENNPSVSRRNMLLLQDGPASGETEPPDDAHPWMETTDE
jgi:hypothetical protein